MKTAFEPDVCPGKSISGRFIMGETYEIGDSVVIAKHNIIGEVGAIFNEKGCPIKYRVDYVDKNGKIESWWEPMENLGCAKEGGTYANKEVTP